MLIRNGMVYADGKLVEKDIVIEGRKIKKIGNGLHGDNEIDASGLAVFPGLIDMHVHFREPGQEWKEDFLSGSRAAVAGGFTLVYDMPNNMPRPTITAEALKEKKKLAEKAVCEVRFHFGTTKDNFEEVNKARPESLKMYLNETTGNLLLSDERAILKHMQNFPKEKPIFIHGEGEMVEKAIELAKKVGRKVHITHAPTILEIKAAKKWKLGTVDCTPHHLFLNSGDFLETDWQGYVKPRLQRKDEVMLLWKNLERIDAVATDHAPHTVEDKINGAYGFAGLETALALFLDAYAKGIISLEWIVSRLAENPAKIMGLEGYGKIKEGYFANLVLVDMEKEWIVHGSEFFSKAKWSPFEGKKLKGKVMKTICRGKIAFSAL